MTETPADLSDLSAAFQAKLDELLAEFEVPGVAAGIIVDGVEHYAYAGVTSLEDPLDIDENTLLQFGSTGKTFTAAAIMRLVEAGKLALDDRVITHVPELRLKDASVAEQVTVLNLLNHTAGWDGDLFTDTGAGDDALAKYVALMADIEQVTALEETVSYNNAALSLAGHLIATVHGTTYEQAIKELVLDPLGLDMTFFFAEEIMTRRFSQGYVKAEGEAPVIVRPWGLSRGNYPAGGMSATARDQIAWARLHLGDGTAADGSRFLSADTIAAMQQPTALMPGSALGEAVGISWLLDSVDGVPTVGHGGTTNGQHSQFLLVPSRGFGFISMANCGPNGPQLNDALTDWALEHVLGLVKVEPEPIDLGADELEPYLGVFETIAALVTITPDGGRLSLKVEMKPEAAAELHQAGQEIPEQPPFTCALVAGKPDSYVIPEGLGAGMKGYFTRAEDGSVDGIHLGGRLATRVPAAEPVPA